MAQMLIDIRRIEGADVSTVQYGRRMHIRTITAMIDLSFRSTR